VESIAVLDGSNNLVLYDVGAGTLHSVLVGARIQREVLGRLRRYTLDGTLLTPGFAAAPTLQMLGGEKAEPVRQVVFQGYDLLADGVRIRSRAEFPAGAVDLAETLRLVRQGVRHTLLRELRIVGVPKGRSVEVQGRIPEALTKPHWTPLTPAPDGTATVVLRYELPPAKPVPAVQRPVFTDPTPVEGSLQRPGYRAIAYPRPKTAGGEDLLMPAAVAAHPRDGRVFVASMKMGEIFVLRDPTGDGREARFENYARGLFQEAYSLLAEEDALYVLHRRNLTRIRDTDRDGLANRLDRVALLPHGVADTYDYGYGLVRDRGGAFVFTYAPYANTHMPGSGGAVRLLPGQPPQEVAYGFRNPFGWCAGPEGAVFFTDNQGEWVATNKLCHLAEGRFYGFPNPAQKQHATRPAGKTAVWVPYDWARSLNGVTCDNSGGRFGPFAGQFFIAELMFGGAIIRAQVEKVNGVYQGACFPFWGKGLLGPLCLTFDPQGRLWVGSITEPGWMAQPDRGALYRIDYTGTPPFEIQAIHIRPRAFRLVFTTPVSPEQARNVASYQIEHYRYEYTGAYGSPELDRTPVPVERVEVDAGGRGVEVTTGPLRKDRVYLITARGVRSAKGEPLVHATGAYTVHEIP
jgi:glucose/arabinose dehydrogenase